MKQEEMKPLKRLEYHLQLKFEQLKNKIENEDFESCLLIKKYIDEYPEDVAKHFYQDFKVKYEDLLKYFNIMKKQFEKNILNIK